METRMEIDRLDKEIERLDKEIERLGAEYAKAGEEISGIWVKVFFGEEGDNGLEELSLSDFTEAYRKIDDIACDYNEVAEAYRRMGSIKYKVRDSIERISIEGTLEEQSKELKDALYEYIESTEKLEQLSHAREKILHSIRRMSREGSDPASILGLEREYKDVCMATYQGQVNEHELWGKVLSYSGYEHKY